MQQSTPAPLNAARVAAFNFGIQTVWGAILAVSLQARSIELAPNSDIRAYATIATLGAVVAAAVQILIGGVADRRQRSIGHRREFYRIGTIAAVPLLIWFFSANTFPQFVCAFFGLQIAMNMVSGPYQAVIPDHIPEQQQGRVSSWMSIFQSLGAAVGLLIAGFVHSPMANALLLSLALCGSFLPTYLYVRRLPYLAPTPQDTAAGLPPLALLVASRGFINLGFYTLLDFLLFYVRDSLTITNAQTQRMDTALIFLCFTIAAIPGAILSARPTDRYDKRFVIAVTNSLIVVALVGLAANQSLAFAYVWAGLAGIAWGAFATSDWALACSILPRQAMATAMGIWNLASVVPQIIAPICIAPLVIALNHQRFGFGPRSAMIAAALSFVIGTVAIQFLPAQVSRAVAKSKS